MPFDEDYFFYGEDSWTSVFARKQRGGAVWYLGCYTVKHYKGGSTNKRDTWVIRQFHLTMRTFYDKHYRQSYPLPVSWFVYAGIYLRLAFSLLRNAMLPEKAKGMRYTLRILLFLLDVLAILLAFRLGWWTRFQLLPPLMPEFMHIELPWQLYLPFLPLPIVLVLIGGIRYRLYQFGHDETRRQIFGSLKVVLLLFLVMAAYMVAFRMNEAFSRLGTVIAIAWLAFLMPSFRLLALWLANKGKLLAVPTLIIGRTSTVQRFLSSIGEDEYRKHNRILLRITPEDLIDDERGEFYPEIDERITRLIADDGLSKVVVFMEGVRASTTGRDPASFRGALAHDQADSRRLEPGPGRKPHPHSGWHSAVGAGAEPLEPSKPQY